MKTFFLNLILCLITFYIYAQKDTIKYDFSFQFYDGIYLEYSNFKSNNPLSLNRIISPAGNAQDFFEKLNEAKTISFYDENGILVNKSKIWGYSKNGKPYIYMMDKFILIPTIGAISNFVAKVTVYHTDSYYDPFYGYNYYNYYPKSYKTEELQQFLIDFETGSVLPINIKNIESILLRFPELHKDYSKLGKRKKTKKMFEYIKQYNEQVPIFFPIDN